jgi:hypothetical protein
MALRDELMMQRRTFLKSLAAQSLLLAALGGGRRLSGAEMPPGAPETTDWLERWRRNILGEAKHRSCDHEMGEELGWRVSPLLEGFYYGFLATHDTRWIEMLMEWTDACIARGLKEPDGFIGWPKGDGNGKDAADYAADSMLGEAMLLRPVVLMAGLILKTPELEAKWGAKARGHLEFAEQIFQKWDSRGCWREVTNGGLWVAPAFGVDRKSGGWSAGYERRHLDGFSFPANKENFIARWLLALHDVTGKPVYRARAQSWFQLMHSRLRLRPGGENLVWNYWEPAGPWDYKPNGTPRLWVGVHPNGVYYSIDVECMVAAYEHRMVFTRADLDRFIFTNRDFMWNQQVAEAKFRRIDGNEPDTRWPKTPGVLWTSLVPYDATLRKIFLANHDPSSWGSLSVTPWFLSLGQSTIPSKHVT